MAENPLPNTTYEYGSYAWRTDSKGRVDQVSGTIDPKDHGRQTTDSITTTKIGNDKGSKSGDVGFHLIGNQFNGPINRLNVVPGNGKPSNGVANLNQGAYASKFESKVKALAAAGKKVEVRIEPIYRSGNNTTRPDTIRTSYRIENGTWRTRTFKNQAGG
ncbi:MULTISPECIES: DNA/RNA non-specific endonuclease [Psychrobacter]|nr:MULTISPECIES: DNA/RNA non-specific endonuclease [Psychrobacter]